MTEQQHDTFSKFGKSFQEKLVKTILFDRNFANQMEEVLDTNYLELKYLQVFVDLLIQHKQSYPHPTYEAMVSVVRTQTEDYSGSIIKQVIEFLARIKSNAIGDDDEEYVKEKSLDFCKKQKLKEAILKSVDLLQSQSFDQIQKVIDDIKTNPNSRRHIVSAWNVAEVNKMALPPCHCLFQFYVADGKLSCQLYQRSCDIFLGVPFNIASYALLTMMMAQVSGLKAGDFVHTLGDAHLYANHLDQADLQLTREPLALPTMHINLNIDDIFAFTFEDFELAGYEAHPHIAAPIAV